MAMQMTREAGAQALFKGVRSPYARKPFPGAICASVNEQVVHGIPSPDVRLEDGDILSIDFGIRLNGYCADSAVTVAIGSVSADKRRLMDVTRNVLGIAIAESAPGLVIVEEAADDIDAIEAATVAQGFELLQQADGILQPGRVVEIDGRLAVGAEHRRLHVPRHRRPIGDLAELDIAHQRAQEGGLARVGVADDGELQRRAHARSSAASARSRR